MRRWAAGEQTLINTRVSWNQRTIWGSETRASRCKGSLELSDQSHGLQSSKEEEITWDIKAEESPVAIYTCFILLESESCENGCLRTRRIGQNMPQGRSGSPDGWVLSDRWSDLESGRNWVCSTGKLGVAGLSMKLCHFILFSFSFFNWPGHSTSCLFVFKGRW